MTAVLGQLCLWGEMIKVSHSVFALPFALIATFLAGAHREYHRPHWLQLTLIVVCMVTARSVAMTFNRIADAAFDARNPRTANRPLPASRMSTATAYAFLFANAALFTAACAGFYKFFGNPWPALLALPVLIYLCGYSFSKRFTKWSHVYLGTAIGLSPLAAWLAIHPSSAGWPAILLSLAVTLWIAGFDIIYACQDIEFDKTEGLHSLPARWGPAKALRVTRSFHLATVILLIIVGRMTALGWIYYLGVALVAALLLIENNLVSGEDHSRANLAFFTMNGIVSVVMGALAIVDILRIHS